MGKKQHWTWLLSELWGLLITSCCGREQIGVTGI